MDELKFTNASITDLPIIVEIYNSTVAGRMVTADLEPVSVESRETWFYKHNSATRPLWMVSDRENEHIGWVSFQDFYGRVAYSATAEISIYLHPFARGKGYGKRILEECIANCNSLKISNLVGFIFAHNEPSLKLFSNAGFKEWGYLPGIAVLDGIERSLKIVGRRV